VRIEGNHEIVELVPGGRSADPDPGPFLGRGSYFDPDHDDAAAGPPPSRFGEWWAGGRPAAWLTSGRDRILRSRAVRPVADAVTSALARVSQRAKIVLALLAIAAAGFATLGVAGSLALRDYVTDRADAQLKETSAEIGSGPSWMLSPGFPRSGDPERRFFFYYSRPLPEGVAAQVRTGEGGFVREFGVTAWTGGAGPLLPADLAKRTGHPFTVPARATGDRWRVLITAPVEGSTLIVAANVTSADAAISRLTQTALVAGGLALAAMAFVGFRAVRSGTPQLTEIERTVEAAVAGDLSRRVPVPAKDTEPSQVAHAVNTLIEQIGDARRAEERTLRRIDEAGRAVRMPLSVIQGFASYYRDAGHDSVRMARLVDRVGDEAARIGVVLDDLVADLSRAANGNDNDMPSGNGNRASNSTLHGNFTPNGTGAPNGNGASNGNGSPKGDGAAGGNGTVHAKGVATGNGAMHNNVGEDRNETAGWRRPG
jgi:HAMP domain-containing protein